MAKKAQVPKLNVIQPDDEEIAFDILAEAILKISDGMRKFDESCLKFRALVILIKDATNVPFNQITSVLNALGSLEQVYLKPKKGGK